MRVQPTPLHCTKCRHEWIGELIVDAPVEVAAASMRALHCPVCGADHKRVAFGRGDVPDPQPVQTGMTDRSAARHGWCCMTAACRPAASPT